MAPQIIAALIIGVIVGAVGVIMIACLVVDGGKDAVHDSRKPERETTSEVQRQGEIDIHTK